MTLHPTRLLQAPGLHEMTPGLMLLLPLELPVGAAWRIAISHIGMNPDHTLRAWLSLAQGGIALPALDRPAPASWNPNRTPDEVVVLYQSERERDPAWSFAVACPTGIPWLNILNLANSQNACEVMAQRI